MTDDLNLPIGRAVRAGDHFSLTDVASAWDNRRAAILTVYRDTHSYKRTAFAFGISYQRVQQIVKRYGRAA